MHSTQYNHAQRSGITQYIALCLCLFSALLWSAHSQAEIKEVLGPWDVHYIVFNSTFLTPEIAQANRLVRSKYNAVVNISVLDSQTKTAQRINISGTARNLLGTTRELNFKRVEDGDAIYYISPLKFRDQETFRFSIDINNGNTSETLEFQQKMWVD